MLTETFFREYGRQTTVTISIFKDSKGRWRVSKYYPHNGTGAVVKDFDFSWLMERESRIFAGNGGEPLHGPVREYEPDERIPLFVLRNENAAKDDSAGEDASTSHEQPGSLMVWLEPNLLKNFRARYPREK